MINAPKNTQSLKRNHPFQLVSEYQPAGDQVDAIRKLVNGLNEKRKNQVLLGVTGSGKTFTIANVIEQTQKPTLVMTHNKTLAAQLYSEMKSFFPHNAVEYFVSYYDYYQPEAYVPSSDSYIEKDAAVNAHIEQMRLSATKALLERDDAIVIASVSAIYGLGDPGTMLEMVLRLNLGEKIEQRVLFRKLGELQYRRNQTEIYRGEFRVSGENVEIFPADAEKFAIRIQFFDDEIEAIQSFDPFTGELVEEMESIKIHPTTHYVTSSEKIQRSIESIKQEFKLRYEELMRLNKLVEAQRLEQKVKLDLEMLSELGYCNGIENYSRHFTGLPEGEPPPTLLDYLPENALLMIDESHVAIPQFRAMYRGDRSRKQTLVEYGFRLPSALDNRPLQFHEFEKKIPQTIFVSATPAEYELSLAKVKVVEQVVRPTGLLDPKIEVRSAKNQVDDVLVEINRTVANQERVLITTLTKRMSENLSEFLDEAGIRSRYLHSDIDTVERVSIIRDLRLGVIDVLVGINLLREGLDIPEVSFVAILDADKEGFLRSEVALIQTIGRAARHKKGRVILYADKITQSMQKAIDETNRRREKQEAYNLVHGIKPQSINKPVFDNLDDSPQGLEEIDYGENTVLSPNMFAKTIKKMEKQMKELAGNLDFENAAKVRDEIAQIRKNYFSQS